MTDDWLVRQVTELKARVKQLEAQRTGYVQAPVTAVDTGSSTFTVQPPAQQDGATVQLSGLAAPPHFLPAVGDEVTLALTGARPRYTPARIAADAVGYTELDPTVGGDITTAKTDATTALTAANGKNTVTYSPNAPSGSGGRVGDIWWQMSGTTIIGGWQWDGSAWKSRTFGDQTLDSLTAAKITSGQIAAGVSINIGSPSNAHTVIDSQHIGFEAVTANGIPYEVAAFGSTSGGTDSSGNSTWQIDQDGNASFTSVSSDNDPIFNGVALSDTLGAVPEFLAGASRGSDIDPANTGGSAEIGYYEFTAEFQPNHLYLLQTSNIWLHPGTGCTRVDLNLRYTVSVSTTTDPPAVSITSPYFARYSGQATSAGNGFGAVISRLVRFSKYAHFRFLLSVASFGGPAYIEMGSELYSDPALGVNVEPDVAQLFAIDLGEVAWTNRAVLNSGGGGTALAPKKRYIYEYYPSWSRWFRGDGSVAGDNGDCYQGQTSYYPANGNEASQIGGFGRAGSGQSLQSDLSGATLEKLECYLYANHWESMAGGTAVIRYHNNSSPGSLTNYAGEIDVSGWARGQGRWVDITSWGSAFQGTGAKGIQVGPAPTTSGTYYGVFDGPGSANPPKLRATFTQ